MPSAELLPANQPPQFYRGGAAIAALRGDVPPASPYRPEDWVASTTSRFGTDITGISRLADGRLLSEAVGTDPVGWLGARHVEQFGTRTGLLVKLLDAGQRLPVHCHPSDSFARRHLASPCGKTEAWLVLGTTSGDRPQVYVGFRDDLPAAAAAQLVATQDGTGLLAALNPVDVAAGDTVVVPAGVPHAIGTGVFLLELQQPSDLSLTLEWDGFLDDAADGHLGIGFDRALQAVDRSAYDVDRLATLIRRGPTGPLLAPAADGYFRADLLHAGDTLPAGFTVLVAVAGSGDVHTVSGQRLRLRAGESGDNATPWHEPDFSVQAGQAAAASAVIPHAAGGVTLTGELTAVSCRPSITGSGRP